MQTDLSNMRRDTAIQVWPPKYVVGLASQLSFSLEFAGINKNQNQPYNKNLQTVRSLVRLTLERRKKAPKFNFFCKKKSEIVLVIKNGVAHIEISVFLKT